MKDNNSIYWNIIRYIVTKLKLIIKIIKVKAHSDNRFNNIVDIIAKEGLHNNILEIDYNSSTLNGISTFKDFMININSRKFMKHLLDVQNFEK
jgi:hypothetical protein